MENKFWKFYKDYGRMGEISSSFIATQEQIDSLEGKSIWLDEPLGKHSEITIGFSKNDPRITEIPVSQETIKELIEHVGYTVGGWFNPFDYKDQWDEVGVM